MRNLKPALPPILSIESQLFVYSLYSWNSPSVHYTPKGLLWVFGSYIRQSPTSQNSCTLGPYKVLVWHWQVWTYQAGLGNWGVFSYPADIGTGYSFKTFIPVFGAILGLQLNFGWIYGGYTYIFFEIDIKLVQGWYYLRWTLYKTSIKLVLPQIIPDWLLPVSISVLY